MSNKKRTKKEMKKEIKYLNKRLKEAFGAIDSLNDELTTAKRQADQNFTDWRIDHTMTDLISGLAYERVYMKDALLALRRRMGSVDTFLNAVKERVPKTESVINGVSEKIANDPGRKAQGLN